TGNSILVAIEAKYLSDWNFRKDVRENARRLRRAKELFGVDTVIQCLLVSEEKWKRSLQKQSQRGSNLRRLSESEDSDVRVIFWEQLLTLCQDKRVEEYLTGRLREAVQESVDGDSMVDGRPRTYNPSVVASVHPKSEGRRYGFERSYRPSIDGCHIDVREGCRYVGTEHFWALFYIC
ncbi:MAG: hypothetical protein WBD30_12405, partial [Bacteroidota bacterium]